MAAFFVCNKVEDDVLCCLFDVLPMAETFGKSHKLLYEFGA